MDDLMDNAPCGFLIFTDDGTIRASNTTLGHLLGYSREELHALYIEKIFSVAGRIFYQTHFFPLLKLHSKVEEIYLDLRSKTGENIPVLVNAARRDDGSGVFFNQCVFVAIRRRNRFEEEILQAKRQAEAATRAKDEFLSMVSHEIRTPLNAILGWSQMLESGKLGDDKTQRAIEAIGRSARAQSQVIEDILDYARISTGKLKIEVGRVNIAEVVEAALEIVTPAANAKNIRLQSVLDSSSYVSGDFARLQQVFWNLLQNSVKFTTKGGRILVKIERVNSSVEISFNDNGIGISSDYLPFVFERFEQGDKNKNKRQGGLGLGLAIVRHIVELHGGTIRAESVGEGCGATFTVRLPVLIAQHTTAQGDSLEMKETGAAAPRFDGVRILVIDDAPEAREMLTTILSLRGAHVEAASAVAEAVEKFQNTSFDLVISDIEMPDEDGFALIEQLYRLSRAQNRKVPIIALTAHARASDRLKILQAGFQMHLVKPVEPAELFAVVANFTNFGR